jgi:hypothetical protein
MDEGTNTYRVFDHQLRCAGLEHLVGGANAVRAARPHVELEAAAVDVPCQLLRGRGARGRGAAPPPQM